ncbi:MAG: hypothetical protein IJ361_08450 [Spirochaetaceae bacterium]|nr:hypothetical protein [Spirochaetaceae bacterium]
MKSFMENFRELDIDELLSINGGYGSSSGGGYGKNSGGTGSYGKVTTSSGNQSSWDVWVANKDGRNSSGEVTRPYDPYRNLPKNSGNYEATSFVPDHSMTSGGNEEEVPKEPFYMQQREFSSIYGNTFGNTACAATSLLNEISERYTLETGKVMTSEQSIAAMKAAVAAGHIGESSIASNGVCTFDATIQDWAKAANVMADVIGLAGNYLYTTESSNSSATIFAWDKNGNGSVDHFVNDIGNGLYYDPWTGQTGNVSELKLATTGLGGTRNLIYKN